MGKTSFSLFIILIFFQGCASHVSQATHDYSRAWPQLNINTATRVKVLVKDERPYVLNGNKTKFFIGLHRGGFGEPWSIKTTSKLALSTDIQTAIVHGLNNSGINAIVFNENHETGEQDKELHISIYEWKSDTYTTTRFRYDIKARVKDSNGSVISENQTKGSLATTDVVASGTMALNELLNSDNIKNHLK